MPIHYQTATDAESRKMVQHIVFGAEMNPQKMPCISPTTHLQQNWPLKKDQTKLW